MYTKSDIYTLCMFCVLYTRVAKKENLGPELKVSGNLILDIIGPSILSGQ